MCRELPILFNTKMVQAILEGRKTVTRRVVKECTIRSDQEINKNSRGEFELYNITPRCGIPQNIFFTPKYQVGDILYVRETWHKYTKRVGKGESCHLAEFYGYKASVANSEDAAESWKPSIHMPKEAARIWLRVTDVRVERLCTDLRKIDCIKEGISPYRSDMTEKSEIEIEYEFEDLWNSTIKKLELEQYGFDADPWIFVYEFERM